VTNAESLQVALLSESPGASVSVKVYRGSQQITVNVNLGELSASAQVGQ